MIFSRIRCMILLNLIQISSSKDVNKIFKTVFKSGNKLTSTTKIHASVRYRKLKTYDTRDPILIDRRKYFLFKFKTSHKRRFVGRSQTFFEVLWTKKIVTKAMSPFVYKQRCHHVCLSQFDKGYLGYC